MKIIKLLTLLLTLVLTVGLLVGCNDTTPTQQVDDEENLEGTYVRIGTLRGPAGMGLAPLMQWAEDGETANTYHFTLGGSPEEMTAGIISGELDIASVPVNVAALLYNNLNAGVQILNIGTLGNLVILDSSGEIETIEDLRGRTFNATGRGGTPQFALEYVLRKNGLEPGVDVFIDFNEEHSELASLMVAGRVQTGMLPQPFITSVMLNNEDVEMAIDLTDAWEAASPGTTFVQGVVIARTAFIEEHPEAIRLFLEDHYNSINYTNANPDRASVLMEQFDIIPQAVAVRAIPNSNIVHIEGTSMIPLISSILDVLYEANPNAVGGAMPSEGLFYKG